MKKTNKRGRHPKYAQIILTKGKEAKSFKSVRDVAKFLNTYESRVYFALRPFVNGWTIEGITKDGQLDFGKEIKEANGK